MYLQRMMEETIRRAGSQTKVVLLTGARQVGKSTSIQTMFPACPYLTLDDENLLILAKTDRELFFRDARFPLIIDEAQYAPELFRTIKRVVDKREGRGQIYLTGSQTYELMGNAAESLAGRISILEMPGLSLREREGIALRKPFLPTREYIAERQTDIRPYRDLWQTIHRGSMPEMLESSRDWEWFYRDYVRTYLERDVRQILRVKDEIKFRQFLTSLAARSGQILVYGDMAKDIGVDSKTVQSWTSVLAASGLVKIVPTYQNNLLKRAIKAPKCYFMDTGLLCYLTGWNTPQSAQYGAMAGNIFETLVVSEILKSYLNEGKGLEHIFYYRDKDKKEIDLLIEEGNTLYPIEIKKSAAISKGWIRHFSVLEKIPGKTIGEGAVLCLAEHPLPLAEHTTALPIEYV